MENHLANHKALAGKIKYGSNYCNKDTASHSVTQTFTDSSVTHMKRKKGNDALGGGLWTNLGCSAHLQVAAGFGAEAAEAAAVPAACAS